MNSAPFPPGYRVIFRRPGEGAQVEGPAESLDEASALAHRYGKEGFNAIVIDHSNAVVAQVSVEELMGSETEARRAVVDRMRRRPPHWMFGTKTL